GAGDAGGMQQRVETEAEAYRQGGIDGEMEAERCPQPAVGALFEMIRDQGRSPPPRASPPRLERIHYRACRKPKASDSFSTASLPTASTTVSCRLRFADRTALPHRHLKFYKRSRRARTEPSP